MIWPDVSAQHTTARVERVDRAEVRSALTSTRLFMVDPATGTGSRINHWLIPTPAAEVQETRLSRLAEAIARSVPCYRVRAGADPAATDSNDGSCARPPQRTVSAYVVLPPRTSDDIR